MSLENFGGRKAAPSPSTLARKAERRQAKRDDALARNAKAAAMAPEARLARLDMLGEPAKKERARLNKMIENRNNS